MAEHTSDSSLQMDELEALRSIYAEDFSLECQQPMTFSIIVKCDQMNELEATLFVTFPEDYPTKAPPIYQLSIPWIRGDLKQTICSSLEEIYLDNIGESIVYQWVEKVREFIEVEGPNFTNRDEEKFVSKLESVDEGESGEGEERDLTEVPEINTGEPLVDRKSTFQAHVATIHNVKEVKLVLKELCKNRKIASATHNMYAYRIFDEGKNSWIQDCDDDGETHAGGRLLHLLQICDCKNVVVVVSRWFGGVLLHGDRFKDINNVARELLVEKGYIVAGSNANKTGRRGRK